MAHAFMIDIKTPSRPPRPATAPNSGVARLPARKPRGPSPHKTEMTRKEIVKAAVDEFLEVGIARATMDKIAKRAGLAKGTLYLYFASKDALLQGALQESIEFTALASLDTPRLPGQKMRDYVTQLLVPPMANLFASGRLEVVRLMLGEARSFLPWHLHFNELMQTAIDEGELSGISAASASLLLGAPLWLSLARDTVMGDAPRDGSSPVELMRAQIDALFGVGR
jgi:AcrR family transcriptional regulator